MEFRHGTWERFPPPGQHWLDRGWMEVPQGQETRIKAQWEMRFEKDGTLNIPQPAISFDTSAIRHLDPIRKQTVECEITRQIVEALIACTPKGKSLLFIDWLHRWFYFDPDAPIRQELDETWPLPLLPDHDARHALTWDFSAGLICGPDCLSITLFGQELVDNLQGSFPAELKPIPESRWDT